MTALLADPTGSGWTVPSPLRARPAALVLPFPAGGRPVGSGLVVAGRPNRLRLTRRGRVLVLAVAVAAVLAGGAAQGLTAPVGGAGGSGSAVAVAVAPGVPLGTGWAPGTGSPTAAGSAAGATGWAAAVRRGGNE